MKIRKEVSYIIDHDGRSFTVLLEPSSSHDPIVRTLPDGQAVIGYLADDSSPRNPREDDQLGVMVCWHRRHLLGDKHDHQDPQGLWASLLGDEYEKLVEEYGHRWSTWCEQHPGCPTRDAHDYFFNNARAMQQAILRRLQELGYTILPLYLYDHSGLTISTGPFSDRWDSGQVGWIYAGPEEAARVGAPPDSIERQLRAEVQEYGWFLCGECYILCLEVFDAEGRRIEEESMSGYLGTACASKELEDQVRAIVRRLSGES